MTKLEERGIGFKSLTEQIDTTTPGGRLIFHLFASLAEFERDLIRERTQAGLMVARPRGRKGGRPRSLARIPPEKLQRVKRLYEQGEYPIDELCEMLGGISRPPFYRWVVAGDTVAARCQAQEKRHDNV
jgi:DNA invertase Pin-like site-specific DNA recombinase